MGRPAAPPRPWHRALSLLAVLGGLGLIGMAAGQLARHWSAPPVYAYVMGEPVATTEPGPRAALENQHITVRRATVMSADSTRPLAELELAESPTGPVLLDWRAQVDDPFLTLAVSPKDIDALIGVLQRHVPRDRTVLAWWDTSRQFQLLAGAQVAFDQHLSAPLFVPTQWQNQRSRIEAIEQAFWHASDDKNPSLNHESQTRFQRFADALLAPEQQGMAALQTLAGNQTAVLVLHLRDMVLLGQMEPTKLGVAFQDFGGAGDVHGLVRRVRAWLNENQYAAYSLLPGKDSSVRAIALTDASSSQTLAARLLPFIGNEQSDVPGATLVYQVGGFSVFEIAPPTQTAAATPSESRTP